MGNWNGARRAWAFESWDRQSLNLCMACVTGKASSLNMAREMNDEHVLKQRLNRG